MTAFVWDGAAANNWASDHWGRGGVNPKWPGNTGSAVTDTVEIDGSAFDPATAPAAPLTVASYVCYGGSFDCGANLTVTDVLTMGTAAAADTPIFSGTAQAGCVVLFQGEASNGGVVGDNVIIHDSASNSGSGTVGDYAMFNDSAYNDSGGMVGDDATFNGLAYNCGTVGLTTIFNDAAYNDSGGMVDNYAMFNSSATQFGEFIGSLYYLVAATTFVATAEFTGSPPVSFLITSFLGSLVQDANPITSDGGTTHVAYTVSIDTQAGLAAANIMLGKTILGVAGSYGPILCMIGD